MAIERTLSIIKPDATKRSLTGKINAIIEESNLKIIAQKEILLSKEQAENFYGVHKERPFFPDLINFITSGPVVVQILEGEDAISNYRDIMGATNPKEAKLGTIRAQFGKSIEANSVHGSDSAENAAIEVNFFFNKNKI